MNSMLKVKQVFQTAVAVALLLVATSCESIRPVANRSKYLIGYTDMRCDDPRGQYYNWRTMRAMIVRADGSGRREIGSSLITRPDSWTQFAGWWRDGRQAMLHSSWESEDNYAWERAHQTFRMTEGWLVDCCLVDIKTGAARNLTAVERVSIYNTGLFPWPSDPFRAGFTALINGVSHPFSLNLDGRNKKDLNADKDGFTYGFSASPDGHRIAYHKDYQIFVAEADGANARRVDTNTKHPFQFCPTWSPDGEWLLFLAGEHFKCDPHVVRADGTGLRKLADRGTYNGTMEPLKVPDFHSSSSDVSVWSPDSKWVYYTAQIGGAVEVMRVSIAGEIQQLTHSKPGTANYHPKVSPDGRLVVFGSTRDGAGAQYVAEADGRNIRPITTPTPGRVQMHASWQPANL